MLQYIVLLLSLAACSADSEVTSSTCGQKQIYNSDLDLALDLIVRAKYALPKIPEDFFPEALDCAEVLQMGGHKSGIYEIGLANRLIGGRKSLSVYCDMDTDGGGWTVIQRRGDFQKSEEYFYQDWKSYKEGFGDIHEDFWLGNDNIFALTDQKLYSVRFDLRDFEQNQSYALYDRFWIDDENHNYTLHISDYRGDAGDAMTYHDSQEFSTKDRKNDKSEKDGCAVKYKGGWWYNYCLRANLNGVYYANKNESKDAACWRPWKNSYESLEWTEIKIRPRKFRIRTI